MSTVFNISSQDIKCSQMQTFSQTSTERSGFKQTTLYSDSVVSDRLSHVVASCNRLDSSLPYLSPVTKTDPESSISQTPLLLLVTSSSPEQSEQQGVPSSSVIFESSSDHSGSVNYSAGSNVIPNQIVCVICGDKASGKHYGVISCEGCKGFFKRTVRKQLQYVCRESGHCPVDRRKRTRCQHCRFERCLSKGMKREAVQEERHRHQPGLPINNPIISVNQTHIDCSSTINLNVSLSSNSLQPISIDSHHTVLPTISYSGANTCLSTTLTSSSTSSSSSSTSLSSSCKSTVKNGTINSTNESLNNKNVIMPSLTLGTLLAAELSTNPNLAISDKGESIYEDIGENEAGIHPLTIVCQSVEQQLPKLVNWARQLPVFSSSYLTVDDQFSLLKAAWPELLLISCAYHSTAVKDGLLLSNGRHLSRHVARLHGLGPLFDRILVELVARFRDLILQRTELALLRAIILFNPDANGLSSRNRVETVREHLYAALHSYCNTNQPQDTSRFTKLLLRLPPLRSISYKCLEHLVFVKLAAEDPTSRRLINLVEHGVWPVQEKNFDIQPQPSLSTVSTVTIPDSYCFSSVNSSFQNVDSFSRTNNSDNFQLRKL